MTNCNRFRAYDLDMLKMYYFGDFYICTHAPSTELHATMLKDPEMPDDDERDNYRSDYDADSLDRPDRIMWMQSTGMLDADDNLIYEGDIVAAMKGGEQYYPNLQVVERHAMSFVFRGITKRTSPHCKFTVGTITNEAMEKCGGVKIIGNTWEGLKQ